MVLDTWLRNPDRSPRIPPDLSPRKPNRDNVLLTREGAGARRLRLVAMDFTHAFTGGRELTRRLSQIDFVQDEGIYGLFKEFKQFVRETVVAGGAARLREMTLNTAQRVVSQIPAEWAVTPSARSAFAELIYERARWLGGTIVDRLSPLCFPQREFDFLGSGNEPSEEGP